MMKRTGILILSLLLTFSLTACSENKSQTSGSAAGPASSGSSPVGMTEGGDKANTSEATAYATGDIILADGSSVGAEELKAVDSDNLPVAVIAGFKADGIALGLGVHRSSSPLQWAPEDTAGYTTKFEDTVCTQETAETFAGDTDGSDNWEVICSKEGQGTEDAENNYPAFYFVNTYADAHKLSGTFASGWYMPSIEELYIVYQNHETVNASLQKIYELDNRAAMDGLDTNWYWSSSQAGSADDYAWFVHYFNGYAGECPKNFTNLHVLAVREFQIS